MSDGPSLTSRPDNEERLIVPVPALVALLAHREQAKGAPLTEVEVLEIADKAECIVMPRHALEKVAEGRGYNDIDPERAWEDWQAIRPTLLHWGNLT